MCLYPTIIKNKKYTATKKNGGNIPAINDIRVLAVPIGCGNCIECRKKKAREWQTRLLEDVRHNRNGKFITLTFSNEAIKDLREEKELKELEGYELDNRIATLATRRFLERWRKKYKKSLRHWLVTEIGHNGTENIHLHGIIWTDVNLHEVEKIWQYGFMWKGKEEKGGLTNYVNERTVNYITKYLSKVDEHHKYYKPKMLTSAGIGKGYMERTDYKNNEYKEKGETKTYYKTRTGHKMALPIYWRNKIYTDEEKEKLWLETLDKEERWICGNKVSIKDGEEAYYRLLTQERERAARLGYGNNEKDWSRAKYEEQRRILKQNERTEQVFHVEHNKTDIDSIKRSTQWE